MLIKSIRIAFFTGILALGTSIAGAQDRIYLQDGSIIEAKVKEINARSIVYRRWDNQEGADYVLTRKEVDRIVYQNGTEEKLVNRHTDRPGPFSRPSSSAGPRPDRRTDPEYGKNIFAIAPMQMTNESVAGVGVHYERFIDKNNQFSIYLPVAFSFFDDDISLQGETEPRVFANFYPGMKIYPGGSDHRISYSVGPSFGFSTGTRYELKSFYDPNTGMIINRYEDADVFKAGFMVTNGLNLQPTKALYVGLELGFGILYYSNSSSRSQDYDEPMVQFNFKMGYRF